MTKQNNIAPKYFIASLLSAYKVNYSKRLNISPCLKNSDALHSHFHWLNCAISDGVADGEVEVEGLPEGFHVVVAAVAGVVGSVDADAEVAAKHQHTNVEA